MATHLAAADGRRVALKWHKLRQRAEDPAFARANLRAGLAAGAVLEVDLVATADAAFVCLHNRTLDAETTGTGPVAARGLAEIRALRRRANDGSPIEEPVLSLAELVAIAAPLLPPGPGDGRIQLDLKERRATLRVAAETLASTLGRQAGWFTLSGEDWPAVEALAVPGLHLGYDSGDLIESGLAPSEVIARTLATAARASTIYLHWPFLLAALDGGVDPVAMLHAAGLRVDAWTVDPGLPDIAGLLRRLVAAGVDQITTNDAYALARIWQEAAA
jgi:glycerophosphoryl diester phosphodiesterase